MSQISKRSKDGRSQRLPLANNLPADNAADEGRAEHGAHNGRGWPWRQGFGSGRLGTGLLPAGPFRALFAALRAVEILRTTASVRLDGWARHRAIRTEHATIARKRFEAFATSFAVIEKLARVGRHGFRGLMSTPWTGQRRFHNQVWLFIHCRAAKLASNISTMTRIRMTKPFLPKYPGIRASFGCFLDVFGLSAFAHCLKSITLPVQSLSVGGS